ncbi:nucleotidyltransferase family protein [Pseudonocardia sp. ICBG1293]|uniref:nucleotidyltransferase family protein n=1 Tax=Pseudonocardia sp. ICBG1293 TaxID=2844382 RepID=UPI001CCD41F4|nr:nucleotidyltransferase family protein [Pseudonocardia sp. ICBG1293]
MTTRMRQGLTLSEVREHGEHIRELGRASGVRDIRVFGSVARGESTPNSDLDLLVDVEPGRGYLDLTAFALGVEDTLGVLTQVVTVNGIKQRLRDRVLAEAVPV